MDVDGVLVGREEEGVMALLYSGRRYLLSLLVENLIISPLTPLVSAAMPLLSCLVASLSSCIRLHCVLVLLLSVLFVG